MDQACAESEAGWHRGGPLEREDGVAGHPGHRLIRLDVWLLVLLLVAGLGGFLLRGGGAYLWPTADNFPLFEARLHAGEPFIAGDLFTQALLDPNPRHVFTGTIYALGALFDQGYYQIFVALGLVCSLVVPQLAYLTLTRCPLAGPMPAASGVVPRLVLAAGIALWVTVFDHRRAFGSWPPLYTEATAHGLSLLLGLGGLALLWCAFRRARSARALGWGLLALATLYHPANGMALWCFHELSTLRFERRWFMGSASRLVVWVLLPALVLTLVYRESVAGVAVDVEALVSAYVLAEQPHHYDLGFIAGQLKTYINLVILAGCVGVAWWAGLHRDPVVRPRLFLALAFPVVVLAAQHGSAFWFPSVGLLLAGPARLLMVVAWMAAVVFAVGLVRLPPVARHVSDSTRSHPTSRNWLLVVPITVLAGWGSGLVWRMPAEQDVRQDDLAVAEAVAAISAPDALVICEDRALARNVRHFGHRAVFFSDNFPFNRRYLDEFSRRSAVYRGFVREPRQTLPALRAEGIDIVVTEDGTTLPLDLLERVGGRRIYRLASPPAFADAPVARSTAP